MTDVVSLRCLLAKLAPTGWDAANGRAEHTAFQARGRLALEFMPGFLLVATAVASGGPFMFPGDLVQPHGVRLEAQRPEAGLVLEPKDSARPKLWHAPMAAESVATGARVWYLRVDPVETNLADQRVLCIGEIRNGTWQRLALNATPPPWGGPSNICLRRSPYKPTWGGFNVFQMTHARDGYRMLYWDQPDEKGRAGAMLTISPDGLHWSKEPGAVFTEYNDAFTLWAGEEDYRLYQTALEPWPDKPYPDNLDKRRRVISLRRSRNLRSWTPQNIILRPDGEDRPETEFYLLKTFPYGQGFVGLLLNYLADPKLPHKHSGITHTELIVSHDGVNWLRPFRGTKLDFWSYADPVMLQGKLHFVTREEGVILRTVAYEPDRLFAAGAAEREGEFTTRSFQWSGERLSLNAEATNGWIEAGIVDDSGHPEPGARTARLEKTTGTMLPLDFGFATRGSGEKARNIRLHFRLQRAKIFAVYAGDLKRE